jgi:methylase of polypeptide subunit release factors
VNHSSDRRFEAFAAREPYFAVLTSPKFLRANLTHEHEAEFFASGQEIVDWIFDVIEQRVAANFSPMSTLEYGSGIGRLAIPFAKRPGTVTAVDRSETMLELARHEAKKQGVRHIEFLSPSQLFATTRKFDLISCFYVFQSLPCQDGLEFDCVASRVAWFAQVGSQPTMLTLVVSKAERGNHDHRQPA